MQILELTDFLSTPPVSTSLVQYDDCSGLDVSLTVKAAGEMHYNYQNRSLQLQLDNSPATGNCLLPSYLFMARFNNNNCSCKYTEC